MKRLSNFPFDGFGTSDSPATISRPFFQTNAANFNQTAFFTASGFDQLGAEVGFDYGQTSVRAALLNGLVLDEKNGAFTPFAGHGPLTKSSPLSRAHHRPDFQLSINHVLHREGVAYHSNSRKQQSASNRGHGLIQTARHFRNSQNATLLEASE